MNLAIRNVSFLRQQCLIDGEWMGAGADPVRDPATGHEIGRVPRFGKRETEMAVRAARGAFMGWAAQTGRDRGLILKSWAGLMRDNVDELARILTAEQGKPLAESRAEFLSAAGYFDYYAEEASRVVGEIVEAPRRDSRVFIRHRPIGVVAAITPWNFPAGMVARKLAPALAAGCAVVLKPAPETPLTALAIAEFGVRAGLPAGVLNVVTGDAVAIGSVLTSHPDVAHIAFTGSTETGRLLMEKSASTIKKLGLELGGHAPFVVLADADIEAAADLAFAAKFRNMGQTCVCPNRLFVHREVARRFTTRLQERMGELVLGNGFDESVTQGPLINEEATIKVERHVEDALARGARLLRGGRRSDLGGTFYEPTLIDGVTDDMLVACEETFGPVAPITEFDDIDAVIEVANNSIYGLAAYIFGRDFSTLLRTAERLDFGMVGMNAIHLGMEVAPIGGIKQSGIGREGSRHGLLEYCEMQYLLAAV